MAFVTLNANWTTFNETQALAGALCGFMNANNTEDTSMTGHVRKVNSFDWEIDIYGVTCTFHMASNVATVYKTSDGSQEFIGNEVKMLTMTLPQSAGVESGVTRGNSTASGDGEEDVTTTVSTLEPRDTFAIQILTALMQQMNRPERFDDANRLQLCRTAYLWANAMLLAAAETRDLTQPEDSGDEPADDLVPVDTSQGTNTEKLLQNIVTVIDGLRTSTLKIANPTGGSFKTAVENVSGTALATTTATPSSNS